MQLFLRNTHWNACDMPAQCSLASVQSDSSKTPCIVACQTPLSMGFSRQEYRSGLSNTSPGDLPDPGNKPRSPTLQADSLPFEPLWELDHKEGWVLKHWCFRTVGWKRLLRVPWTARRSTWSILKEINPEYSLEELMLKFQYFGHLMQRGNPLERSCCWERLRAGGEGGDRD